MENIHIAIPKILNAGIFDFKIKFGKLSESRRRRVDTYEIEIPLYSGGIAIINNCKYSIESDKIICAKPGQYRSTKPPYRCFYLHIAAVPGDISDALSCLPDIMELDDVYTFKAAMKEIVKDFRAKSNNIFSLYGKLLMLIDMLQKEKSAKHSLPIGKKMPNISAIESALEYINDNFTEKLTLQQIANRVYLSPIYFRSLFLSVVGITPYDYIKAKRIELAEQLLASTDMPLVAIAIKSGFSDQAYFCKVFKDAKGCTPREYRIKMYSLYP